tara:strand:+ start:37058 stop:38044 length:987 start_codon:yes stop_codon:yes gene_type:complete
MTEEELKRKWKSDQAIFARWGEVIKAEVTEKLAEAGKDPMVFFKIQPEPRLKSEQSLIDKAFYRDKDYSNPYAEIEDKVGVRFVVLLLDDIKLICDIVEGSQTWDFDACKHFDEDKQREPLLFTYQSVHYILRPKTRIRGKDGDIPTDTPCEVQIRTLLQHAHAELTHDAIYKSKKAVRPIVHRTVAKSMALIETTDEFFSVATKELNFGPIEAHQIVQRLNALYYSFTGIQPHVQKSTLIVLGEFENLVSEENIQNIQEQIVNDTNYAFLAEVIKTRYPENAVYQQSIVLFVYWMLITKKRRLLESWPLANDILEHLATDVGVSIFQ